jgi:hypothetical protein
MRENKKRKITEFSDLGVLLKYLCASPKNKVITHNMELYMDENNVFHVRKIEETDFRLCDLTIDELISIVRELKKENRFNDIAINVIYCEI